VNILDPQTQVESTVVATFHQTIAMLIFLRLNVHFWLLRAMARSFDYLPPSSGHFGAGFATAALQAGASVFVIGIQIAAPVLSATLIADVALGLLGKASPQLPLMLLGPAVKSILGILILMSALKYWPNMFEHLFLNSMQLTDHLLHLAR
jgi:flagellar biosynthetic protein FliR